MRRPERKHRQAGFSLVEVLCGVSIFALVAAGTAASTVSTIQGNTVSRMSLAAGNLIFDQVERFRALDPQGNPAEFAQGEHLDPDNPIDANGEPGGSFVRSWQVFRNDPHLGLARVLVTVAWQDTRERSLTYATYVCLEENCS